MNKTIKGMKILTLSTGNKKLVTTSTEQFLIWNLLCQSTCPFKTDLCTKDCYAKKAENLYPTVKPCRTNNTIESTKPDFVYNMTNTINYYINKKSIKGKTVYFRIHESGDFYSQTYYDKFVQIAKNCPTVQFLAYTKSVKYVVESKLERPTNLCIRYSIWDDTKKTEVELADSIKLPIYTAFMPKEYEEKLVSENCTRCTCDCTHCKKCYSNKVERLAVAIH